MYCHSEICIATPKYVIQAACTRSQTITERVDVHYCPTNGRVTCSSSLYRPHTVLLPSAAVHPRTAKRGQNFEHAQNSCRAWIDGGVRWTCSTVGKRPTVCLTVFRRLHQLFHTVANGESTRQSVTAALGPIDHIMFNRFSDSAAHATSVTVGTRPGWGDMHNYMASIRVRYGFRWHSDKPYRTSRRRVRYGLSECQLTPYRTSMDAIFNLSHEIP